MKGLLLYNKRARRGSLGKRITEIVELFKHESIELEPTLIEFDKNPFEGHEDIEIAVTAGGDGTINYVVNMMRAKGINPQLGIIPAGTANDFASAIGMRPKIMEAARQIAKGKERMVDCGVVNGRYFVNVFGFGVLTTASHFTSDKEKQLIGKLAYIHVGIKDIISMHNIPLHIEADGTAHDIEAVMCLVFNGNSAGQFRLAADAKIDDGELDLLVLEHHNAFATCRNMVGHLLGTKPEAVHHIRCHELTISSNIEEPTDVDGEPGPQFPMHIRCEKGALRIRC
ncbi:MAG: YegS/Rv2252/BmrU family lipid kinase [Alistipes sp.]|nr:YegS/Rv2252/BmrU family lipid kinase [Alistipes sp.]